MELLQEKEVIVTRLNRAAVSSRFSPQPSKQPSWARFIKGGLLGLLFFLLSFLAAGVFFLKRSIDVSSQELLSNFEFLVLAQGAQVQIDEVGRFLKQIDGVENVLYISPEAGLQIFQKDSRLIEDLKPLDVNPLPPLWQVVWNPTLMDLSKLEDEVEEIRRVPGVLDISFNPKTLQEIHRVRYFGAMLKTLISMAVLGLTLFGAILLGYGLFFAPWERFRPKDVALSLLKDELFWAAGFFLVRVVLGPVPWWILAGGIVMGGIRVLWDLSFRSA